MLLHWIWFAHRHNPSAHMKQVLLQHFSDPEEIWNADESAFADISGLTKASVEALLDKDLTEAAEILTVCRKQEIGILTYEDEKYPNSLRNTYDPPMLLYYRGILPNWEEAPVVGIVGTRKATPYGLNTARNFGKQISVCGAVVVSGGAAGIDSKALEGALEVEGQTVVVLGCGVDVVYPAENRGLFHRIRNSGCLIAEFKPGEKPRPWHFLQRNRIITGISNALLVVEAPEKSGALNSARHAMEQGRDVFAVPGNVGVTTCVGSNLLLQDGAHPALSGWDVVREYEAQYPGKVSRRDLPVMAERTAAMVAQPMEIPGKKTPGKESSDKKSIDKEEKSTYSVVNNPVAALSEEERHLLTCIPQTPVTMDEVIDRVQMQPGTVKSMLTKLAIKGILRNHPGGRISRKS